MREDYDTSKDFMKQDKANCWAWSLRSGDKFYNKKWKKYYEINPNDDDDEDPKPKHLKEPMAEFGLFNTGTVIGAFLDTDRGFITFFKDGNELGLAFKSPELKEGSLFPFI